MGKIFGLLAIVLGIYVGMELYTEGMQNAFGGVFAKLGLEEEPEGEAKRPLDAIRDKATRDFDLGHSRRDDLIERGER